MGQRFAELRGRFNLTPSVARERLFAELVADEAARSLRPRVLDIGCGTGIGTSSDRVGCLEVVRRSADELWGVEPDEAIRPTHGLLDRLVHRTLEGADLPEAYFDVAYAFLVKEHVQDPKAFLEALCRVLKPGGRFVFLTLNSRHYFTRIAKLTHQVRVDEHLLRLLRPREVDGYHYPVVYRFNEPTHIASLCASCGFVECEFVFQESSSPVPYFPGPLRPVMQVLDRARRRRPESLLNLIGRLVRE